MFLCTWSTIVCTLSLFVASSKSNKILFMPLLQSSHISSFVAIARVLGGRHHETHVLVDEGYKIDKDTDFDAKKLNMAFIHVVQSKDNTMSEVKAIIGQLAQRILRKEFSQREFLDVMTPWVEAHAKLLLLENEPLIEKLQSAHYDLAVIDGNFCTKHFYLLAHRLGIPWVTYTDYPDTWMMRVPWLPSIVPGKFSFQTEKMSFLGRISNAWLSSQARLLEQSVKVPDNITKQYQQYGVFDSPEELMGRSKFWILTSDAVIDSPKPIMPHMVEVGGLTTNPAKKLPEDIQSFLDGAEDGVILVSFGSMLSTYPDVLLRKFLEAFNRIERHRFVWRLTNVSSEFRIPDFIRTDDWLPQNDILGHPKVKLFINHCGNNGQFEALHHGVPMIGFPFNSDQPYNSIRIENKGFGIGMNAHKFTSDELYANILKILNDPGYKRRISLASEIYRSAPQRPAERAAFWIEHVIKFGSNHLQSAGKDLNFFQYFLLDVLATFALLLVGSVLIAWKLGFWVYGKVLKRGESDKMKTN